MSWLSSLWLACTTPTEPVPQPSHAPTMPAQAAPTGSHEHAHTSGDHMQQMAETREQLRTALGEAYDRPVEGLDNANTVNGKLIYDQSCASCHGVAGKGDGVAGAALNPPPADFTDAFHARYYSDAGRVHIIEKGSPGTAMVGFEGQLEHAQILDVYAYIATMRGAPASAADDHSQH